jgi:hypothetical protein
MKKRMITLTLVLMMCLSFAAMTASADSGGPGGSFETAIRITPTKHDEEEVYTNAAFAEKDQAFYFVFTAGSTGKHYLFAQGRAKIELYDSSQNHIERTVTYADLEENATYYLKVTSTALDFESNRDFGVSVVDETEAPESTALGAGWSMLLVLVVFGGYFIAINFPYKRYLLRKYEFNVLGFPFKLSMILVIVSTIVVTIAGTLEEWFFILAPLSLAPGFIMLTLSLIKKTREPKIIIINSVLMAGFYVMVGIAAMAAAWVAMLLIGAMLLFGALGARGKKRVTIRDGDGNYIGTRDE